MSFLPNCSMKRCDPMELDPTLPYIWSEWQEQTAVCRYYDGNQLYEGRCPSHPHHPDSYPLVESLYQAVVQGNPLLWGNLTGVRPVKLARRLVQERQEPLGQILAEEHHLGETRRRLVEECLAVSLQLEQQAPVRSLSIYVGIPFCPSRCGYCSFFAEIPQKNQVETYLQGLYQELEGLSDAVSSWTISAIYLGGGTPTVLTPPQLEGLLTHIRGVFPHFTGEFTVEAGRPDTITAENIELMCRLGVGRISVNPQSFHQKTLDLMGRSHSVEESRRAIALAQGKFYINMDLIMGLTQESPHEFRISCEEALSYTPSQLTLHSHAVKRTASQRAMTHGSPEEWTQLLEQMYHRFRQEGYRPYYLYRQKRSFLGGENVGWYHQDSPIPYYNVAMMEEFQTVLGFGAGAMTKGFSPVTRLPNAKFARDYIAQIPTSIEAKRTLLDR